MFFLQITILIKQLRTGHLKALSLLPNRLTSSKANNPASSVGDE